jgi:hypothetical protein
MKELFPWGWPQTSIFPISASQVARITGMSHWCLAEKSGLLKSEIFPLKKLAVNEKQNFEP